jgi:uncharacterized protein (DUF58 family)
MISPRTPLLILTAAIFVPAISILIAIPSLGAAAMLTLLAFGLIVILDAAFLRPDFSTLRVLVPETVRLSKGRDGEIQIKCVNDRNRGFQFRIGFPFPNEICAAENEFEVDLGPLKVEALSISCRPQQRGRFFIQKCYARAKTRLRLWNVRGELPLRCELRVYPDLLSERRNITALFLRRGMFGFRKHRQIGKGREFEKLRDYITGDSIEDVHWKATAKRGHPVTKVFQIERTQEVYVIVDSSRLSRRWSGGTPMLERFVNCALVLCLAAAKQGDLFGLITFSDKVQTFVRAKNGQAHYDVCRDALYTLQPQIVSPNFEDLFTFLRLRLRRRALLVFLTALDDPALAASFTQHADLLTRQHFVLVNMIQSPEARPLFTDSNLSELDEIYRRLGGHLVWAELQEIGKRLQRLGAEFSFVSADKFAVEAVNNYVRVKQRQLL